MSVSARRQGSKFSEQIVRSFKSSEVREIVKSVHNLHIFNQQVFITAFLSNKLIVLGPQLVIFRLHFTKRHDGR